MRKIGEVLRLHFEHQLGQRSIARAIDMGQSTVHDYLARFAAAGLEWPLAQPLTEAELDAKLYPPKPDASPSEPASRSPPDFTFIHDEMKRGKHTTLDLLWHEYRDTEPDGYSYSRFCHLYEQWRRRQDPVMRQHHIAGEKLFIDWAGSKIAVFDRQTSAVHQASLFVATLGASSYTYAEATWTQALPEWIGAHIRAFSFLGGVPALLVPDNTKTAVLKPCRYDPDLNPTYHEMAKHYGVGILPARVRKPRDKAVVECGVLVASRWIIAALRHRRFFSLIELNQAIAELQTKLNARPFKKRQGSRASVFASLDQPALRSLPPEPYDQSIWSKAKVHLDHHVQSGHCFFSVPWQLVGEQVETRVTPTTVEIFHRGERVASHLQPTPPNRAVTDEAHRPPAHRALTELDITRIREWATQTGPFTTGLVEHIMSHFPHPEMGFRSCLGVIRRAQRYPAARVEAAAERTLAIGGRYKSFCSILDKGLDQRPMNGAGDQRRTPDHDNIRGVEYFEDPAEPESESGTSAESEPEVA